jgi:polyisoprenoid-binding protein YceI
MSSETTIWNLDPTHTLVELSARHMMITTVKGRFTGVTGAITANTANPAASSVEASIDAATIDTGVADRDTHLRSADFLDVENHPTISFRSTGFSGSLSEPGSEVELHGDLTIRGVTRPVVLTGTFDGTGTDPWGGQRISFSARTTIDRRDFGLVWSVALETGGVLVGNDVKISLEVQAVRA